MRSADYEEGEPISHSRPRNDGQTYIRSSFRRLAEGGNESQSRPAFYYRNRNPDARPKWDYERTQAQQMSGLAALIGIATQVSLVTPEAATAIIPPLSKEMTTEGLTPHNNGLGSPRRDTGIERGPLRKIQARLLADHLVRSSLYLMLSSGLQAGLGFAFWVIMARLFSTEDVGRASSLASATALLAILSLFGMNTTLVRFLPTSKDRDALVTAAIIFVASSGAVFGLIYLLLTPVIAPPLAFVEHHPAMVFGFVVLASAAAVNLLTDSVFIAHRKAGYTALTDGAVSGTAKIVSGFVLAGTGAFGLFSACALGFAAAAIASLVLIATALRWRPVLTKSFRALKPFLRFSIANYVGNTFVLLPTLVVPVIILDRIGTSAAAYYFVAFQIATLLYSAVYSVESAFLAEGSRVNANWRETRRRSRRFAMTLFIPACLVLILAAHWVLLAFGAKYSHNGTTSLIVLALAVVPLAASNWSWTVFRITGQLKRLVFCTFIFMLSICCSAWFLAPHGLTAVVACWPIGCSLSAVVAGVAVIMKPQTPPHSHRTQVAPNRRYS